MPLTVFIPTSTLTEIPGLGFRSLGGAMAFGRVPLQEITVENLLGVQIDHVLVVPDDLLRRLLDRAGGIDVAVPEKLLEPDAEGRLIPVFQPGRQHFDGARAVDYLQYRGPDESELTRFVRAQEVWEALYGRYAGKRAPELARLLQVLEGDLVTDATPKEVGQFFAAFAAAGPEDRVYRTLPVQTVGSAGPEEAFRVDQAKLEEMVGRLLADSLPPAAVGRGARVQVLNGNGKPEVGARIAEVLVPAGFRITVTGNAGSFSYKTTKIIVYDDADLPIAQRVRQLLGVGVIEIGLRPQTIVDVTVVVGRDFITRH